MTQPFHVYEPAKGHRLAHDPFNSIVGPRPIGWISSQDLQGRLNLAPYSFFNAFNYKPPIIGFASNGWKDSVANLEATKEFGWSLTTLPLAEAMNQTCAAVGSEVDEFALAGLTPAPSLFIGVPRVAESPVSFECKVTQVLRLQGIDGKPVDTWVTFGEVVAVHIDTSMIEDGVYKTTLAQPIVRGGGPGDYFKITTDQQFFMRRPGT